MPSANRIPEPEPPYRIDDLKLLLRDILLYARSFPRVTNGTGTSRPPDHCAASSGTKSGWTRIQLTVRSMGTSANGRSKREAGRASWTSSFTGKT
jgi:hypothetical protein